MSAGTLLLPAPCHVSRGVMVVCDGCDWCSKLCEGEVKLKVKRKMGIRMYRDSTLSVPREAFLCSILLDIYRCYTALETHVGD